MLRMLLPESVATLRKGAGRFDGQVRLTMSGYWFARVAAYPSGDTDLRTQFALRARDRRPRDAEHERSNSCHYHHLHAKRGKR